MGTLDDPAHVREQYADGRRLGTRASVWQNVGRTPADAVAEAVGRAPVESLLDIGFGPGYFADRMQRENPASLVVAADRSPAFARGAAEIGLASVVTDIQALPFGDGVFGAVVAMWMLYHVPDVDRALREVRRVLHEDGSFSCVTNGPAHLARLHAAAGVRAPALGFSVDNGEAFLARHFASVTVERFAPPAVFRDHAHAVAYLSSLEARHPAELAPFEGRFEDHGDVAVFLARGVRNARR